LFGGLGIIAYLCSEKENDISTITSKYIDLLTDYGFKRVFGSKDLLIAFLNALFEEDGKVIKSVTYRVIGTGSADPIHLYILLLLLIPKRPCILEDNHAM